MYTFNFVQERTQTGNNINNTIYLEIKTPA